ncbi:phosphate/phosphite/phosphonate ABC transporter substrate-binding protein [Roseovarius sp. LXJ103]|uniref:phosphate/phosphite/phosphonate ABC transporter substrate-binding protein n=1 Tax=Roseovarius carneus TaxID=2853164 RepID=UPI000D622B39|nr:phosphate/phosphite/phosphonate ABC transporter substrate-binding protein [Roseovarius carneus]MBZ8117386.1 phosphate/phosphite/phosphonate ABC transporter substrate-binding protein [Roseovarius carneus]PWE36797.1 phosphate ABC transporter substrate-binding protein [Pelagicola sp. LXJ1103]
MKTFATLTAMLLATTAAFAAGDHDPDTLRVALLPDENASTVIQDNKPLAAYLEEKLGKDIELIVTTDYSSMIEAMRFGRVDVAYFGPASYTIAKAKMAGGDLDIEPFAARMTDGSTTYQSVLIANVESGIDSIDDIEGSGIDVAFGDQASTSSHFAPKYTMMLEGVTEGDDYTQNFTGAHDAVARNVELGNAAVGGLSRPIYESLLAKGSVDESKLVVIGYSADIPQYPWVLRTDMTEELEGSIKDAFLTLERGTEVGDAVLKPFKADAFAPITDADYDIIRDIRKKLQAD